MKHSLEFLNCDLILGAKIYLITQEVFCWERHWHEDDDYSMMGGWRKPKLWDIVGQGFVLFGCFWSKLLGFYPAKNKAQSTSRSVWRDICSPRRSLSKLCRDTLSQLIYNQHLFSGQTSWSELSRVMLLQTSGKWEACDLHFFLWLISQRKGF